MRGVGTALYRTTDERACRHDEANSSLCTTFHTSLKMEYYFPALMKTENHFLQAFSR